MAGDEDDPLRVDIEKSGTGAAALDLCSGPIAEWLRISRGFLPGKGGKMRFSVN